MWTIPELKTQVIPVSSLRPLATSQIDSTPRPTGDISWWALYTWAALRLLPFRSSTPNPSGDVYPVTNLFAWSSLRIVVTVRYINAQGTRKMVADNENGKHWRLYSMKLRFNGFYASSYKAMITACIFAAISIVIIKLLYNMYTSRIYYTSGLRPVYALARGYLW